MDTIQLLKDHLRSVYQDGAWSEVSVRGAFAALTHVEASARPIPGRHTAWEILLHLDAWHRAVALRLQGQRVDLPAERDWPQPEPSTADNWRAAIALLNGGLEELLASVASLSEEALFTKLPGGRFTLLETIIGVAEHDMYHAGQVTLLKRKR